MKDQKRIGAKELELQLGRNWREYAFVLLILATLVGIFYFNYLAGWSYL